MNLNRISRRSFIQKTAITSSIGAMMPVSRVLGSGQGRDQQSREVWIAGFSQMNLHAENPMKMVDLVLETLKDLSPYSPDFVCLPESFAFANIDKQTSPDERAAISVDVLAKFADYSRQNNCYTICPVYTRRDGKVYNSAVMFDRLGNPISIYEKIHLTDYEINAGYTCGPLFQPVVKTEFGPVGVQICFDIEWDDGWRMIRQQEAAIIFWPSAFSGGKCVNTKAWEHKCVVASATIKNTAKLCDISGEVISQTGIWNPNLYCATVNLEKAFLHTWPAVSRFGEIQKKYGRKIKITNFHEEEWSVIESLSPDIYVKDVLREFGLRTHEELTADTEVLQKKSRI